MAIAVATAGALPAHELAADPDPVKEVKFSDPNPFASYEQATAADKAHPMAVEWHQAQGAAIEAATAEDVLAAFVRNEAAALALLAQLREAYATEPLVMTQIAAVTQWVMRPEPCWLCFWKPSPGAEREIWTAALRRRLAEAKDDYIRVFCRQQLDLCECRDAGK